jgi:hypothetical protein
MYLIASGRCQSNVTGYFHGKFCFTKEFEDFVREKSKRLSSASACARFADRLMADAFSALPKEEYASEICVTSDGKTVIFRVPEKKS